MTFACTPNDDAIPVRELTEINRSRTAIGRVSEKALPMECLLRASAESYFMHIIVIRRVTDTPVGDVTRSTDM
jgi:hypothetical protein